MIMKPPLVPSITIPATEEATSEYRVEQSTNNMMREGLKPAFKGKAGAVFKRGVRLDPERCLMTTPLDGWTPMEGRGGLKNMIPPADAKRLDKMFSDKGLAATIAITDTVAGVREQIDYDENEQIVKPIIEEAKSHLYHEDCDTRLIDGYCKTCNFSPDMQSLYLKVDGGEVGSEDNK